MGAIERATEIYLKASDNLIEEMSTYIEGRFVEHGIKPQKVERIAKGIVYGENWSRILIKNTFSPDDKKAGCVYADIDFETGVATYEVDLGATFYKEKIERSVELHKGMVKLVGLTAELIELRDSMIKAMEENYG